MLLAATLLANASSLAQQTPRPAPTREAQAEEHWKVSLAFYDYILPDEDGYAGLSLFADRGPLHLEARYNYEDLRTGSLWIGRNFSAGKKLVLDITPMLGGVFGRTTGIAPGCNASLTYKRLELSISNEYVFDTGDSSRSFYYSWPQLTYSLTDWFVVGLAAQHTKAFRTALDTQRGFLVGFSHKKTDFRAYIFNVGVSDPSAILEIGWSF